MLNARILRGIYRWQHNISIIIIIIIRSDSCKGMGWVQESYMFTHAAVHNKYLDESLATLQDTGFSRGIFMNQ